MNSRMMRWSAGFLVAVMFIVGAVPRGMAGFLASEPAGLSPLDRGTDLGKIQKSLESKIVRERLRQLGFTSDEIQGRLEQLSDEQIHQLALRMDAAKVGGDAGVVAVAVLLVLLLVVAAIAFFSGID